VNLELSRLFYGVGLVAAGIAAVRDRRLALGCCAASLAVPFLMLSLTGAGVSGVVLWAIGYLLFGFFTVFRVVLFADIAACEGMAWLAGAGLMLGRVGDVLGTALCLACGDATVTLIGITSVLFVASMGLMFALYQGLHANPPDIEPSVPYERDALGEFCATYGLSAREREVLPLLLAGKTNAEIAAELFVSVNTVKYHTRNIRQKTGCETRLDVVDLYVRSGGQLAR
jgi:DNA-binding CsgD family transcriptional regulator